MDLAKAARPTHRDEMHLARVRIIVPRGQSNLGLRYASKSFHSLSLVPRPSRPVFVIHGSSKTNSGFFPCVSNVSGKC